MRFATIIGVALCGTILVSAESSVKQDQAQVTTETLVTRDQQTGQETTQVIRTTITRRPGGGHERRKEFDDNNDGTFERQECWNCTTTTDAGTGERVTTCEIDEGCDGSIDRRRVERIGGRLQDRPIGVTLEEDINNDGTVDIRTQVTHVAGRFGTQTRRRIQILGPRGEVVSERCEVETFEGGGVSRITVDEGCDGSVESVITKTTTHRSN